MIPVLPVIAGKQDPVVNRCPHQDAFDDKQGQEVYLVTPPADYRHRDIDAALNNQHQDRRNNEGPGRDQHDQEDCGGGQHRNGPQFPGEGSLHLIAHCRIADQVIFPRQPVPGFCQHRHKLICLFRFDRFPAAAALLPPE